MAWLKSNLHNMENNRMFSHAWRHGGYTGLPRQYKFSVVGNELFPYAKFQFPTLSEHEDGHHENAKKNAFNDLPKHP